MFCFKAYKDAIKALAAVFWCCCSPVFAQDITRLGGDLTSDLPPSAALELPAPNIQGSERISQHLLSHADFHGSFELVRKEGKRVLGPDFNHNSCGGCHVKDGRGPLGFSKGIQGSAMLVKVALQGLLADRSPKPVPGVGEQLRDHTINGKIKFNISLKWSEEKGRYPDGSAYTLRRPRLSFDIPQIDEKTVVSSLRMTPPVIGMGLLEAVPAESIEAMSDPRDVDRDGISGRVNYVLDKELGVKAIGRFGYRATHPTIKQQSAAAFFNDMGVTNEVFSDKKKSLEVDRELMARIVFYQQAAGVTPARMQDDADVIEGKRLFQQINCQGCHKLTLRTADSNIPELVNQEFHPFTDLLLHDMGADLSDKRKEFSASGREWRTTPLWGLGLVRDLLPHGHIGFLHDGRARSIEEAILWHGGEARRSRQAFKKLSASQRAQLLKFLQSL